MTAAEALLWARLRARQQGFKVRRQHLIGAWVVDFFVASVALAIEVDGVVHEDRGDDDAERTLALRARGVVVIRFTNEQVINELDVVLARISTAVREQAARRADRRASERNQHAPPLPHCPA